jgi:hypothetical protein
MYGAARSRWAWALAELGGLANGGTNFLLGGKSPDHIGGCLVHRLLNPLGFVAFKMGRRLGKCVGGSAGGNVWACGRLQRVIGFVETSWSI